MSMRMGKVEICGVNTSDLKVLSSKEKEELLLKAKDGDKKAREQLISGNLKLVLSVIKRFSGRGENPDDLFQVGCIGLIKAIDNFDMSHNVKFSTYAVPMNIPCRKDVKMRPRKWTDITIKQAFDEFIKENGRLPTKREMYDKHKGKFPRPLSAKLTLGVTLAQYINENYSFYQKTNSTKMYGNKPDEYWIQDFKKQYIENGCPTEKMYNKLRKPQTPNSQTLAKIIGVDTWGEVLDYCKVRKDIEIKGELVFDETFDNLAALSEKLRKFINARK